jgi:hypothetical protein
LSRLSTAIFFTPHGIPDEFDELLEWIDRLILACDSALARLPDCDPRSSKRGRKQLAWTANELFHMYLAYGLSAMSPRQRHEEARGPSYDELFREEGLSDSDLEERTLWSVRPENYRERRDDFVRTVLDLAGVDGPSSDSGLDNWRAEFSDRAVVVGRTPPTRAMGLVQYWFCEDWELTVRAAEQLRERMLAAMQSVAEARQISPDTCTVDGGPVFGALARCLRYDHPPLQTPHSC